MDKAGQPIRAMVMAAGRGERMRPLTDSVPKPLLDVRGQPLVCWALDALARGGVREAVINTAWLGEQIERRIGPHSAPGNDSLLSISYSREGRDFGGALETAGGIARALPLLGDVFWVLAGDVYAPDFDFSPQASDGFLAGDQLAHIWLVPNPAHNPKGDFGLDHDGMALNHAEPRLTYSTIGLYRRAFFDSLPFGNPQGVKAPLAPLLRAAMDNRRVSAQLYEGRWTDVGTPERLAQINTAP